MNEFQTLHMVLSMLGEQLRNVRGWVRRDETGALSAEQAIFAAILAAAAIAIGTIIVTKFTGKANSIPTE